MSYEGLVEILPFDFAVNKPWEPELMCMWKQVKWEKDGKSWKIGDFMNEEEFDISRRNELRFFCGDKSEIYRIQENEEYTPVRAMMEIRNTTRKVQVFNITCNKDAQEVLMVDCGFGIIDFLEERKEEKKPEDKKNEGAPKEKIPEKKEEKKKENKKIVTIYYRNDLSDLSSSFYITLEHKALPYRAFKEWLNIRKDPVKMILFLDTLRTDMFPTEEHKKLYDSKGPFETDKPDGMERIQLVFEYGSRTTDSIQDGSAEEDKSTLKVIEKEEIEWLELEGRGPKALKVIHQRELMEIKRKKDKEAAAAAKKAAEEENKKGDQMKKGGKGEKPKKKEDKPKKKKKKEDEEPVDEEGAEGDQDEKE